MNSNDTFNRGLEKIVNNYIRDMPNIHFHSVSQFGLFMSKLLNCRTVLRNSKDHDSPKYNGLKAFLEQLSAFNITLKRPIDMQTVRSIPGRKEWAELVKASRNVSL